MYYKLQTYAKNGSQNESLQVTKVINKPHQKTLIGTLWVGGGSQENSVPECHIHLVKEVFQIEKNVLLSDRKTVTSSDPTPDKSNGNLFQCIYTV